MPYELVVAVVREPVREVDQHRLAAERARSTTTPRRLRAAAREVRDVILDARQRPTREHRVDRIGLAADLRTFRHRPLSARARR